MAKNLATTFAALNNVKKIVDGKSQKGSAPKATQNTTAKGVATQKATPTPVIEKTPKKSEVRTSKATKTVSKAVNTVEKVKSTVSKYAPSITQLTGAVTPNKNTNYGDVIRSAFDKKNVNKRNAEIPVLKNDRKLINYYESIPNYNALQRLTSFEKNNAYNQKQALTSRYRQAKDRTIPALLNRYGVSDEDINALSVMASRASNPNKYFDSEMQKLGFSDSDIDYVRDYAQRLSRGELNSRLLNAVGKNTASKAVGTIASLPLNPLESLGNVASQGVSYLSGKPMTNDNHLTRDIRDVASENLGTGGKFAYDVGTSIGDMATALLLANLTGGGSSLSAGAMGLEKASDVINEGIERNLTPDQIMAEGIASGLTTALTEKIPMGKWDDIAEAGFSGARGLAYAKELGKKIVASAIPEAGQEAAEDLADAIADAIITGDKSQINDIIRMYEQNGLSHDEATAQAWIDFAKQMGIDALAGGISGGVVGGGNAILRGTNAKRDARAENAANQVIENVGEIPFFNTQENTNADVNNSYDNLQLEEIAEYEQMHKEIEDEIVNAANNGGDVQPLLSDMYDLENSMRESYPELFKLVGDMNGESYEYQGLPNTALPDVTNADVNNSEQALLPEYENLIEELENEDSYLPTNETVADAIMQSMYNSGSAEMNRNANNSYSNPLVPLESVQNEQTVNDTIPTYNPSENGLQSVENGEMGSPIRQNPNQKLIGKKGGKESQFSWNTLTNMPTFTQNEESAKGLKKVRKEGLFNYDPVTNKKTMDDAVNNLSADPSGEFQRLVRQDNLSSATDVAESMLILDLMQKDVLAGTRSASEVWNFAKDMQKKVTGMGQGLQMLSHFTRTASSTLMKAEKMRDIKAKNIGGKEERAARKFSSTLERVLAKIGYDGTINNPTETQKTFEQILTEVKNTMDKESASVFDNFTEEDMQYLANLIHQGAGEQRIYDALCKKLSTGYWDISEADVKRVIEIFDEVNNMEYPNSKEANDLENEAYAIMAKYLGDASFKEKWNQWRYLAMLGNPRTHLRNIVGNFMFGTLTNVKDNMAGITESALNSYYKNNDIERQRAFVSRVTDNNLIKASSEDFNKSRYKQATDNSNKYMMDRDIERHRELFKSKGLQKVAEANTNALDWEDTKAIQSKYSRALASYLKANGKGADIFNSTDKNDVALLDRARDFAVEQAKIATFHEDSSLANFLNGMSRAASASDNLGFKAVGTAIEAVVPFKKTPINILKQGVVEYNPVVQIPKAFAQTIKYNANNPNNQISMSDVIDTYCKGLSGAGILALGAWLASKGILKGHGKDEEDYAQGNQEYSVEWDFNGKHHSYTMDWAAPSALPLFMGAELYKWWDEDTEHTMGSFFDVLASIGAPAFELSMLEGVNDAIKNFGKSTESVTGVMSGVAGLGASYLSQAVPTLGGQIARTIDPTRRSTYTGQEYGGVADVIAKQGIKTLNKIPGLSYLSQPYVDTLGHEAQNDDLGMGAFGRGLQNFLSPGYHSVTNTNDVFNELSDVAQSAKESGVDFKKASLFPKAPDKTVDGHRLTPQEYTEASKAKGQITEENLKALFESESYRNASESQKVDMIKEMLSKSNQMFKHEEYGNEYDDKSMSIYDDKGIDGVLKWNDIKATMDGNNSNGAKIEALNQSELSDEDLGYYASQLFSNPSGDAIAMQERYGDIGLYYWYSIASQSTTKAGRYDAIEQSNFSNDIKESLLEVLGESGKKNKETTEPTTESATPQTSNTIPTFEEFLNSKRTGQPIPQVTSTKQSTKNTDISNMVGSANGKTWVDFGQAVPYLMSQNLSAEERGQAYYNTGDKSSGKQQVYNDMGYPGVAQYYENQYYADQAGNQDNKKQKAEVKSYLKSLGFSNEDISYWMGVYGWKP